MRYVILAVILGGLLTAGSAGAEISLFSDSSGNSGTIITPGGPGGGISFYSDSFGNTGTIITPGGNQGGGLSFYNISSSRGEMTSGTIQTFGVPPTPAAPLAPLVPITPYSGLGSSNLRGGGSGGWQGR